MKVSKVSKAPPLREQAYNNLKAAIVNGKMLPGQRLTEEAVAEFLGVSRTPAREALGLLCQEGALERRPGGGYLVPVPSVEKIEQIFEVRELLEPFAVRLAAMRATPEDLKHLAELIRAQWDALDASDPADFMRPNRESRNLLFRLSGNAQLVDCIARYNDHLQYVGSLTLRDVEVRKIAVGGYERIHDAVAAGDPDAAEAAMRKQLKAARLALTHSLSEASRASWPSA